jgi:hypothetical protein
MSENGSACALDTLLHRWNGSITSSSPGVTSLQHIQAIKAKSEAEQKRKEKKAEMARPTRPAHNPNLGSVAPRPPQQEERQPAGKSLASDGASCSLLRA